MLTSLKFCPLIAMHTMVQGVVSLFIEIIQNSLLLLSYPLGTIVVIWLMCEIFKDD